MSKQKDVTRREFIGTTAAAGSVLVAGSKAIAEPAPPGTGQADEMAYYFGYGSNLNVEATLKDLLPNGKFLMRAYLPNYQSSTTYPTIKERSSKYWAKITNGTRRLYIGCGIPGGLSRHPAAM